MSKTLALIIVVLAGAAAGLWWFVDGEVPQGGAAPFRKGPSPVAAKQPGGLAGAARADDGPSAAPREPGRHALAAPAPAQEPVASARQAHELHGLVVDARGSAVPGARVILAAGRDGWAAVDLIDEDSPFEAERVEVQTGVDGRFRASLKGGPGIRLAVRREGFAPLRQTRTRPKKGDLGKLVLEDSIVLEGLVVDDANRPVAGASLHALQARGVFAFMPFDSGAATLARTDEGGRFRLNELAAGPWRLLVRHPEHPDHVEQGETGSPGEIVRDLVIRLDRGFAVEGRVEGLDELEDYEPGSLVVRALPVRVFAGDRPDSGLVLSRRGEIRPDASFRIGGLAEGEEVSLTVSEAGQGEFAPDRSPPVLARAGDRGVVLRIAASASIIGRVVDGRTGEPIEGYLVEVGSDWLRAQMRGGREVRQHPDGRFRYEGLEIEEGAEVTLQITADGYRRLRRTGLRPAAGRPLDVGTLALEPAPLLPVRVVAANTGEPVKGASVRLAETGSAAEVNSFELVGWSGPPDEGEVRQARTGPDGIARVTALPGRTARLLVRAKGFVHHRSEPFTVPAVTPSEPMLVELLRGGTAVVRVVDPDGVPVADVRVEHRAGENGDGEPQPRLVGGAEGKRTDADGIVRFERLAPGLHRFRLGRRGGSGDLPFGPLILTIADGEPQQASVDWTEVLVAEGGRHELTLIAPVAAQVRGLVTESGQPLPGASVELHASAAEPDEAAYHPLAGPVAAGNTDGKGTFRLPDVDPGEYRILVNHASRAMPWESVVVLVEGVNEFRLDLPVTAIEGRVVDEGGRPLEGARVTVSQAREATRGGVSVSKIGGASFIISTIGGDGEPVTTDSEGRFQLRGVIPDVPLVLRAWREGGYQETKSKTLQVAAGEIRSGVELTMQLGGTLAVRLVEEGGEAVMDCAVWAQFVGESEQPVEGVDGFDPAGAEILLEGLRPGPWRVGGRTFGGLEDEGREAEPVEVEVRAGERLAVTLHLPPR